MGTHSTDYQFMQRAIELALLAETEGNLPIGAVIVLEDQIIAEGRNTIWAPKYDATRHAEMEALRNVPQDQWDSAASMVIYTTLEPCLMCFSSILLHKIGGIVFGSFDNNGGASPVFSHLPPYFQMRMQDTVWSGPALPEECDPLLERARAIIQARKNSRLNS